MVSTAPKCRIAEFQDGTIRIPSAQEKLERDLDTTVLIEPMVRMLVEVPLTLVDHQLLLSSNLMKSTLNHKWVLPVEELMDLKCRTAESLDGTTRTQFALAKWVKDQATTVWTGLTARTHLPPMSTFSMCLKFS